MRATLNGADIVYEVSGSGPPLIALHGGLGFDHSYMVDALAAFEDLNTVYYVDQRGNGLSERVELETITIPQLAADVDALREHLGFDKVGVAGHSYGGFVALEHATAYPDRVSHLMLLSTGPGAFEPAGAELAARPDPADVNPVARAAVKTQFSSPPSSDEEFEAKMPAVAPGYLHRGDPQLLMDVMDQTIFDAATLIQAFIALSGWSAVDRLDRVTAPTLVTCGRFDLHTTPECSARLASAIGNAELVWFEQSAHFPWLEEREAFNEAVRAWLSRLL